MARTLAHRIAALAVGGVIAGGLGWLTGVIELALVTGVCWSVGVGLALRIRRLSPRLSDGDGWADVRWTGLGIALVTLAGLLGVSPALSLSPARQFGLSMLVLGAGLAAFASGTMAELERRPDENRIDAPEPGPRDADQ